MEVLLDRPSQSQTQTIGAADRRSSDVYWIPVLGLQDRLTAARKVSSASNVSHLYRPPRFNAQRLTTALTRRRSTPVELPVKDWGGDPLTRTGMRERRSGWTLAHCRVLTVELWAPTYIGLLL